ncbi:hypothetical protein [Helicobacter sp. MIT 14-3879]|uniref:hypothetical protein n=1 Tax=Helicobacter sp. MIT 14-3879 TaxID=2040649 RepID=UPI000E1E6A4B|nr:hypothetical protein [Helicobacter sp. MIT 14-3879]RDU59783.1 hypothetical protein CQA44_11140 [Helicobacter sp. MIT 14-3879]
MKIFIFIVVGLGILLFLSSCGLLYTTKYDKEAFKLSEEYGGIYVFNKEIRDEIKKLQEEEIAKRRLVENNDPDFYEKMIALEKKYSILSNGCKYFIKEVIIGVKEDKKEAKFEPYYQKIKEYMGEKVFNKLDIYLTSYYKCGDKVIPISFFIKAYGTITEYGLYGFDEVNGGYRFSKKSYFGASANNIFYLINDKFVKSNQKISEEKTEGRLY